MLAANSLLLAGSLAADRFDTEQIFLMQWCGFCGVYIIYRFNDLVDHSLQGGFSLRNMLRDKWHLVFLFQFFLLTVPAVFWLLSPFRIALLAGICILGVLYSVNFGTTAKPFRFKNIFLVKNLFIGLLWGCLIPVGAGAFSPKIVTILCIYSCFQVFIGSIIRDIPDRERDGQMNVRSFPVVFGTPVTIGFLQVLNLVSAGIAYGLHREKEMLVIVAAGSGWRAVTLLFIRPSGESRVWTQTFNLLNCLVILAVTLIFYCYEHR